MAILAILIATLGHEQLDLRQAKGTVPAHARLMRLMHRPDCHHDKLRCIAIKHIAGVVRRQARSIADLVAGHIEDGALAVSCECHALELQSEVQEVNDEECAHCVCASHGHQAGAVAH